MPGKVRGGDALRGAMGDIARQLAKANVVRVGYLEGDKYDNGQPVAMIAAIQNYGAPRRGIPPRPFFSNVSKLKAKDWPKAIADNLRETNYDSAVTLDRMGQLIQAQIRDSIVGTYDPPLSPITVMLRGMRGNDTSLVVTGKTVGEAARRVAEGKTNYGASTKPLIDSGVLLRTVNYQVKGK